MLTESIDKSIGHWGQFFRSKGTMLALSAVAVCLGLTTSAKAQDSTLSNSTAFALWIQEQQREAAQGVIGSSLDRMAMEPNSFNWGKTFNFDNLELATKAVDAASSASDTFDLWKAFQNRQQKAEASYELAGFFLKASSSAAGSALLEDSLEFDSRLREADLAYKAYENQNEARSLAFGGVLSSARPFEVRFASPEYDDYRGAFDTLNIGSRLSISGDWTAAYGDTSDRLSVFDRYAFNRLQTVSGQVLTGTGFVSHVRVEQHSPFQDLPLLRWVDLFNFDDPMNMTERTRRHESYNVSFNGALANQSIQRAAEFNPHANNSAPFNPSAPNLYDQGSVKHPPTVYLPQPSPPRPQAAILRGDKPLQQKVQIVAQPNRSALPPSNTASNSNSRVKPGGVKAEITIDDSDFAPPKKEEKK